MRFIISMAKHEADTYSPAPTLSGCFGASQPLLGEAAPMAFHGTIGPMTPFIDLARVAETGPLH